MLYRQRSKTVEAEQIDPRHGRWPAEVTPLDNIAPAFNGRVGLVDLGHCLAYAWPGDWILRWPCGAVTLCRRDDFRKNFEPLPAAAVDADLEAQYAGEAAP